MSYSHHGFYHALHHTPSILPAIYSFDKGEKKYKLFLLLLSIISIFTVLPKIMLIQNIAFHRRLGI